MGGFRVLPSLGSCNKETLACRDCALPTWRPSPVTLGRGEGNAEAHSSWPQRDACQPSSRRRGAALCLASARPLSQDAALKSLTRQLCTVWGASAGLETHLPFPASPSLPATRAVLGPRVACSLEALVGQARGGCAKVRGSAAASASGSLLPARLTRPLAGPAPSVLHLGRGSSFCRDWLWSHKTGTEPQLCHLDNGCMSSFWQPRLPSSVRWV